MKIGILSDTHSEYANTVAAVRLLQSAGAEQLIHCGDVGDTRILDVLVGLPTAFVFGNNDYDHAGLRDYAGILGINCLNSYGVLTLAGKRIAITHGDDHQLLSRLRRAGQPNDYVLTGHTHRRHDERLNGARWINPGALHRATVKTVATLDLATDALEFHTVGAG
ncbi:MAG: YfcE family phosphodiesterase [Burkholderiales bacterium]|nr:YfcE family phosphodiesterase [Phycisphaerae bacterium]